MANQQFSRADRGGGHGGDVLDTILSRLEKVRANGQNQWLACCPAHEDRTPSLSVRVCSDGAILLKCFAGCSTDAIVDALGLTLRDLFAGDRSYRTHTSYKTYTPTRKQKPVQRQTEPPVERGRIVRELVYDYCDGHAEPYVRIVREEYSNIDPKKGKPYKNFPSSRWDRERGEYVKGISGLAFVPYDAPSVKEATTIFWCEGEKKCSVLAAAIADRKPEIVCSTRWGGSGSALQPELIPWFIGKHVVIFADADDTGIKYAKATAIAISHVAKSVKILLPSAEHDIEDLVSSLQSRRNS